jgi:hypothetical protein
MYVTDVSTIFVFKVTGFCRMGDTREKRIFMKQFFRFFILCLQEAWHGCWTRANELSAIIGAGILWVVLVVLAPRLREGGFTDGEAGVTFVSAVASAVLTFSVLFLGRLLTAPGRLWFKEHSARLAAEAQLLASQHSDIQIILHGIGYEAGLKDIDGGVLPTTRNFLIRVTNNGEKFLQKCQVIFGIKAKFHYPVSGYFDLRRGEYKDLPVLRLNERNKDARPIVYFLEGEDWQITSHGSGWAPGPGLYEIRVLSADTGPAVLEVTLSQTDEWHLSQGGTESKHTWTYG